MAMMPKRVKFRKAQRGKMRGTAFRGSTLAFGEFGLKALENAWMTDRQIEAISLAVNKRTKTDVIMGYFWGFVLGVAGSLVASYIYSMLKRKKSINKQTA